MNTNKERESTNSEPVEPGSTAETSEASASSESAAPRPESDATAQEPGGTAGAAEAPKKRARRVIRSGSTKRADELGEAEGEASAKPSEPPQASAPPKKEEPKWEGSLLDAIAPRRRPTLAEDAARAQSDAPDATKPRIRDYRAPRPERAAQGSGFSRPPRPAGGPRPDRRGPRSDDRSGRPGFGPRGDRPPRGPRPEQAGGQDQRPKQQGFRPPGEQRPAGQEAHSGRRGGFRQGDRRGFHDRGSETPAGADRRGQPRNRPEQQDKPAAAPPTKPAQGIITVVPATKGPAKPTPQKPAHLLFTIPAAKAKQAPTTEAKPSQTAKDALRARAAKAMQASVKEKPANDETSVNEAVRDTPVEFDASQLSAGWDTAVDALRAAGDTGPALVEAWLGATNTEALAAAAEAEGISGASRKAARRAINILKSRGVALPTRTRIARFGDDQPDVLEATMIPPDGSGTLSIAITSRDSTGRYRIAEVVIRDPVGVMYAGGGWLSGSRLKEGRARAQDSLGTAPVPVPLDWARFRIAAAKQQNSVSGQVLPLGYEACRELVEPGPEVEPTHPLADLHETLATQSAADRIAQSLMLHNEPEFRNWMPPRLALDELLKRIGQRLGVEGAKDHKQVDVVLREELLLATDRYFSPETRALVADRLRDSAISLRSRKGDDVALNALAVAKAVKEAGLITSPPREVPFLTGFFQKALAMLMQQGGGQLQVPVSGEPEDDAIQLPTEPLFSIDAAEMNTESASEEEESASEEEESASEEASAHEEQSADEEASKSDE